MPSIRRTRGRLLRLVLDRRLAILVGFALVAPAAWLTATEHAWENGISDGLALITSATGLALIAAGLSGRRPDWDDPETDSNRADRAD